MASTEAIAARLSRDRALVGTPAGGPVPPEQHTIQPVEKPVASKAFALLVPLAYLALIVYLIVAAVSESVPDLQGGDAAALVGGIAGALVLLAGHRVAARVFLLVPTALLALVLVHYFGGNFGIGRLLFGDQVAALQVRNDGVPPLGALSALTMEVTALYLLSSPSVTLRRWAAPLASATLAATLLLAVALSVCVAPILLHWLWRFGGVGAACLQLGLHLGARVIASVLLALSLSSVTNTAPRSTNRSSRSGPERACPTPCPGTAPT